MSLEGSEDQETRTKASGALNAMRNIDFICGLMILKNFMLKAKMLSDYLQVETINVAGALKSWNGPRSRFLKTTPSQKTMAAFGRQSNDSNAGVGQLHFTFEVFKFIDSLYFNLGGEVPISRKRFLRKHTKISRVHDISCTL